MTPPLSIKKTRGNTSGMPKSSKLISALPPKTLLQTPPVNAPNPANQGNSLQKVLRLVRVQEKEVQALRSTVERQNATIPTLMMDVEKVIQSSAERTRAVLKDLLVYNNNSVAHICPNTYMYIMYSSMRTRLKSCMVLCKIWNLNSLNGM